MQDDEDYIRNAVLSYFMDSGITEKKAHKKLNKLSYKEVCKIYDHEPYFEREGK